MEKPIEEKKEEEKIMDVTPESVNNEGMELQEDANKILENREAEMPMEQENDTTPEPAMEVSPELSFPTASKKTRRAKCPPGCMRKPKCSSTGGKRSKKSKNRAERTILSNSGT